MTTYRLTTNGMLRGYRSNLQKSYKTLGTASERVQTGRNFLTYAEDPSSATLAFKLRREYWQSSSHLRNNSEVASKFQQAWSSIDMAQNKLAEAVNKDTWIRALNDPDASGRRALGQETLQKAESLVETMNAKYAGRYLFAGADGANAPFTLEDRPVMLADGRYAVDESGNQIIKRQLCYRGVAVDQPAKIVQTYDSGGEVLDDDGNPVMIDNPEYLKLQEMMNETTYVDIGLGMEEYADGTPNAATVYNSALSGLEFLDFGYDEDGDPKNVVSMMLEGGERLMNCRDNDGSFKEGNPEYDRLFNLTGKLDAAANGKMHVEYVELDTKAKFLTSNEERLKGEIDELGKQIEETEQIDPAKAITELSWAQYCYNAGLKIGTSILTQSLIDYMN